MAQEKKEYSLVILDGERTNKKYLEKHIGGLLEAKKKSPKHNYSLSTHALFA